MPLRSPNWIDRPPDSDKPRRARLLLPASHVLRADVGLGPAVRERGGERPRAAGLQREPPPVAGNAGVGLSLLALGYAEDEALPVPKTAVDTTQGIRDGEFERCRSRAARWPELRMGSKMFRFAWLDLA